eukprot:Sspe_Gene.3164::Locus_1039_Transcript_1_1_Confidence_1.000_Length_1850::g.3164::m.3164
MREADKPSLAELFADVTQDDEPSEPELDLEPDDTSTNMKEEEGSPITLNHPLGTNGQHDSAKMSSSPKPPCTHNNWDNVRVKKGMFGLRCRTCQKPWKVQAKSISKCPAFWNGYCPSGDHCPLPHIHRYKNPEKEEKKRGQVFDEFKRVGEEPLLKRQPSIPVTSSPVLAAPPVSDASQRQQPLGIGSIVRIIPTPEGDLPPHIQQVLGHVGRILDFDSTSRQWMVDIQLPLPLDNSSPKDDHIKRFTIPPKYLVPQPLLEWPPTYEERVHATFAVPAADGNTQLPHESLTPEKLKELDEIIKEKLRNPNFLAALANRPCNHNNWDNVRMVKGKIGLRCRDCGQHWKADVQAIQKCLLYFNGYCPKGIQCPLPHIHRYKNKSKEAAKAQVVANSKKESRDKDPADALGSSLNQLNLPPAMPAIGKPADRPVLYIPQPQPQPQAAMNPGNK